MLFARIDLSKTDYSTLPESQWKIITDPDPQQLEAIYNQYCIYKQFRSVMPIFPEEYTDSKNDVIGYYDQGNLVAFSLVHRYNDYNAEAIQFAWDYANPKLHLGIASLRNECAIYKAQNFHYFYLGGADEYKRKIKGFEVLGPRH